MYGRLDSFGTFAHILFQLSENLSYLQKNFTGHKICVSCFCTSCVQNMFCSAVYLVRYPWCVCNTGGRWSCRVSILVKWLSTNFHENNWSSFWVRHTYRLMDVANEMSHFYNHSLRTYQTFAQFSCTLFQELFVYWEAFHSFSCHAWIVKEVISGHS